MVHSTIQSQFKLFGDPPTHKKKKLVKKIIIIKKIQASWRLTSLMSMGATMGKLGPTGIGSVLCDCNGRTSIVFFEPIGQKDSNEAEFISIRRALSIW